MRLKLHHLLLSLVCLALVLPSSVSARVDHMTFDVYLNSGEENVNTFGGVLHYPASWSVERVALKDSSFIYWINSPDKDSFGSVSFSGAIPGGVQNFEASDTKKLLYSIYFAGDIESSLEGGVFFEEEEFYLNHPAALAATESYFTYSFRSTDTYGDFDLPGALLDLSFSFEEDPITRVPTLVLNSYRGNLASYSFESKEGDFNTKGWIPVDGIQALESSNSTVQLNILDSEGASQTLIIRKSPLRISLVILGVVLFSCLVFYLFNAAFKILHFKPQDLKQIKR